MNKELNFFDLFDKFISESLNGKRLKKDGSMIRKGTVKRYGVVRDELLRFSLKEKFELRVLSTHRLRAREIKSETIYWNRFYKYYSNYLYKLGCFDNYVGAHFKVIRTFFNYLNNKKGIITANAFKNFFVRSENIPIIVMENYMVQFLKQNEEFEDSLPAYLKRTKDIFVFGCYVGLRFSDLMQLTNNDLQKTPDSVYIRVRSIKTSVETRIKLSSEALRIIAKYRLLKTLLPQLSNNRLNLNLKELCERAGWTHEIGKRRERRGVLKKVPLNGKSYRFCDLVTTHTMRRTSITYLLSMGMPEVMVRKLSGHSANSKEFYRYVNYAQQFIDQELDRINNLSNIEEKETPKMHK